MRWVGGPPELDGEYSLFYYGGCRFVGEGGKTLATYDNGERVMIECLVGKGKAILSGVHPEYCGRTLNPQDPYLAPLIPVLIEGEEGRRRLFEALLTRLISS